jgi:hypothetical protein
MKVVCVETKVQVVLGIMDDDGDIIEKHPLGFELPKLNEEAFKNLVVKVEEAKGKFNEALEKLRVETKTE